MNGDNTEQLTAFITRLLQQAHNANHRRCLVIAGEQSWTRQVTEDVFQLCPEKSCAWVSSTAPENATTINPKKIQNILGDETDLIILDAYSGFNPDVFGAVAGIIRGGGLLLLLTPKLSEWDSFKDPSYQESSDLPSSDVRNTSRFLTRLSKVIRNHQEAVCIEQNKPLPTLINSVHNDSNFSNGALYKTEDQRTAVEAIKKVVTGHRRRPLVLTADRGRGKTAALGIAAAQLMQQGVDRIIVTAPRADAVNILFKHAAELLTEANITKSTIETALSKLEFIPPDELVRNEHKAKLLIVDEAAAIPAPVLEQLLKKYSRVVFASTIHGYEGTGRGFAIRFQQTLQTLTPSWKHLTIHQPIRWAENDPLEDLTFKALLLDASQTDEDKEQKKSSIKLENLRFELINRDELVADETSLQQLFGLLVNAHYQTKPSDLRDLLDGSNLSIFVLRNEDRIIATALIATEGGFDEYLANDIYLGKRRPHGHLIPEVLATHLGLKESPLLTGARVVRIAVEPCLQSQGLGSFLLDSIKKHPSLESYDYLATSFGATINLLEFWKKSNYLPIRIGFQRNASSGEHSVLMFNPISHAGEETLQAASKQFYRQFPEQLSDSLQDLETDLIAFLLVQAPKEKLLELDDIDKENLTAFVDQQRIYEASPASIKKLALLVFRNRDLSDLITAEQKNLLIKKVLQKHSWKKICASENFVGKKAILKMLKETIQAFLKIDL